MKEENQIPYSIMVYAPLYQPLARTHASCMHTQCKLITETKIKMKLIIGLLLGITKSLNVQCLEWGLVTTHSTEWHPRHRGALSQTNGPGEAHSLPRKCIPFPFLLTFHSVPWSSAVTCKATHKAPHHTIATENGGRC